MRTSARLGLAAAALAAAAATPALAQSGYGSQGYGQQGYDRQAYPPSTYDRGSGSGYQSSGSSGYDRQGYPPSSYDRGGAQPGYDRGGADQGQDQGDDPEALARRLNLTSSQRSSFDAYQRAFAPDQARDQQEEAEMRRMASMTTPQRLDAARAAMGRDRADFDRTEAATRSFYAQLSPAQRRTFDQLTAPQMDEDGPDQGGPSPTQPTARPPR